MKGSSMSLILENITCEWNDTDEGNRSAEGEDPDETKQEQQPSIVYSLILVVVLIVGLVGNCAFMYVTVKVPSMRTVLNIYLVNLCIADTLFLVTGIPTEICMNHIDDVNMNAVSFFHSIFSSIPQIASLFIMALVSIERYLGICHPFRARYLHTRSRVRASVVACWLLGLLLSLPYTACSITMSLVLFTVTLLCQIMAFVVSMCTVFILYSMIICKLRREEQALTNNFSSILQDRKQVIVLLVVTTSVFFFCVFPEYVVYFEMLLYSVGAISKMTEKHQSLQMLAKILLFLNSAVNALIYNVTCAKYREAFRKAFRERKCCWKNRLSPSEGIITPPSSRMQSRQHSITTNCDVSVQTDNIQFYPQDDLDTYM